MKKFNIKFISILLLSVFLYSCETDEVQSTASSTSTKQDILTFKTVDEFNETLAKVNAMTKTERKAWENERGFKSFGTICEEFYNSINFDDFSTIAQIKELDPQNLYLNILLIPFGQVKFCNFAS